MNFWGLIGTLRKFGNFAVGLFPFLGRIFDYFASKLKIIFENPVIKNKWESFLETDRGKSLLELFRRHYWHDYSADRLNLEDLPKDAVSALRAIFLISIALCVLIPLAIAGNFPAVTITEATGRSGDAQIWSISLWLLATAFAWGASIAGATVSNRPIAAFLLVVSITVFGTASVFSPRSFWNLFLAITVFLSIGLTEKSLRTQGKKDLIKGFVFALIAGIPAGVYLIALTPLHAYNCGNVMLTGAIVGAIASMIPLYIGRGGLTPIKELDENSKSSNVSKRVWILTALTTTFLASLAVRGGWQEFGSQLLATNAIWYGYLWPVWYFIGVGIIFKLLKNTKLFSRAVKHSLPNFAFIPVVLLIVLSGLILTWSEGVVGSFSITASEWQVKLTEPFFHIYKWSNPWLWKSPELSQTAQLLKWILGFELVAIIWLFFKRKLNNESAASLLYALLLSTYLIYEYNFQQYSFHRTPGHSIALLSFFSISLLWLFHRIGLKMSLESSPLWPSSGRLPLYGGILLFCLCELHARCALKNWGVMNSIFLVMFLGIIDVGLPYFLYIFATKRFKKLPIKLSTIFGVFCLGAVLALPVNALDKFAMCNWSIPQFIDLWKIQDSLALNKGLTNLPYLKLPLAAIILKSALFTCAILFITSKINKLELKRKPAAILFATLAFASGLASFSKTAVDLPILPQLKILFNPAINELTLNANVIFIYLTAWLPTFLFAFSIAWKNSKTKISWIFAGATVFSSHFILSSLWPNNEAFLRSSGLIVDCLVFLCLSLLYLIILAVRRMEYDTQKIKQLDNAGKESKSKVTTEAEAKSEAELETKTGNGNENEKEANTDSKPKTPVPNTKNIEPEDELDNTPAISTKELHALALIVYLCIAFHANNLFNPAMLVSHSIPVLERKVELPLRWGQNIQKDPKLHAFFNHKESNQQLSSIIWSVRPTPKGGNVEILESLTRETLNSKFIANFNFTQKNDWNKYYPGALEVESSFEIIGPKFNLPRLGMTVFLPRKDQKTEIISIICVPEKFDQFYWDIVRMAKASSKSKFAPPTQNIVELAKVMTK